MRAKVFSSAGSYSAAVGNSSHWKHDPLTQIKTQGFECMGYSKLAYNKKRGGLYIVQSFNAIALELARAIFNSNIYTSYSLGLCDVTYCTFNSLLNYTTWPVYHFLWHSVRFALASLNKTVTHKSYPQYITSYSPKAAIPKRMWPTVGSLIKQWRLQHKQSFGKTKVQL